MRRYYLLTIFSFLLLFSCTSKSKVECEEFFFNENDYILKQTKLGDFKQKLSELYVKKEDQSKKVLKLFWHNDKIQAIIFLSGNEKNGPFFSYDTVGNLSYSGFYMKNKETGISCYYDNTGTIKKMKIYDNGKDIGEINDLSTR
ncbi:MAG: hypothetical protein IT249_11835 [Chitinophagaceae bacterium]|nr:hypothetical protein [Chitinophagaceae bacterium]